jgi:hypothetical protein
MSNFVQDNAGIDWLSTLKKNPIATMMDSAPLPVRYALLSDVLDEPESDLAQSLLKNLRKHQPRRTRFAEQAESGLWPLEAQFSKLDRNQMDTLQLIRQLETLHELIDLAATAKQEKMMLGMREVVRLLAENTFTLRLHHLAQAIYLGIFLGLEGNPIIKQLIWDVLKMQNPDGGWPSLQSEKTSCIWSSQFFLWSMGHSEKFKQNRSLKKGLEYLRENALLPEKSKLLPAMQTWDTLIAGSSGLGILHGGSLRLLEVEMLYDEGARSRKTEKRVDWLLEQQLNTGLWPSIVGRDKRGDHSVTLRALSVLKHFQSLRLRETQEYDDDDDDEYEN